MRRTTMLLIGDLGRREFAGVEGTLGGRAEVIGAGGIGEACGLVERGECVPEVVVLAQARPGEFSHAAVDRLRRAVPLARFIGLLGSWCEGEMRTGSPWPGVHRVYWHQWPAQSAQELARLAAGQNTSWALPVTATEEERLLVSLCDNDRASFAPKGPGSPSPGQRPGCVDAQNAVSAQRANGSPGGTVGPLGRSTDGTLPSSQGVALGWENSRAFGPAERPSHPDLEAFGPAERPSHPDLEALGPAERQPHRAVLHPGLIAISAWSREMHDWLAEALRRRGHATAWFRPGEPVRVEGASAAVFDATEMDSPHTDRLRRLAAALGPTPIVALLDFPRIEDRDRALAAGATAVLSKPLTLDDLYWQLDQVCQRC